MARTISPEQLIPLIGTARLPDRRRRAPRTACSGLPRRGSPVRSGATIWQFATGRAGLPADRPVVVYCLHGHNVSALAATLLAAEGADVCVLEGGIEAFAAAGGLLVARQAHGVDAAEAEHLGDPRAAQDRSHRLSLADPPLHRPASDLPFRAGGLGRGCRRGVGRDPVRHRRRALFASRRDLHLRHADCRIRDQRSGSVASRPHRARRGHCPPRSRASICRAACAVARAVGDRAGRSAPARSRDADLRCAVRLVPSRDRGDATTGRRRQPRHERRPVSRLPPSRSARRPASSPRSGCCPSAGRPARSR